jgi:hypothetical protein
MDTSKMSAEQSELVGEGRALVEEHSVAVLAVALANKVVGTGNVPDGLAGRAVALCIALFVQQTRTSAGAVARRPRN